MYGIGSGGARAQDFLDPVLEVRLFVCKLGVHLSGLHDIAGGTTNPLRSCSYSAQCRNSVYLAYCS